MNVFLQYFPLLWMLLDDDEIEDLLFGSASSLVPIVMLLAHYRRAPAGSTYNKFCPKVLEDYDYKKAPQSMCFPSLKLSLSLKQDGENGESGQKPNGSQQDAQGIGLLASPTLELASRVPSQGRYHREPESIRAIHMRPYE